MFPRPFDKRGCHFPFDWRTSLLSSRDSFIPAARTCSLRRADRIQVATMSHIIPLYLELASEIPTPASFLCPFENRHNITKHAEPIPSTQRYDAGMFFLGGGAAMSCLVLLLLPLFLLGGGGQLEDRGLMWLVVVVGGGSPPSGSFKTFVVYDKNGIKPILKSCPWILTFRRSRLGCYQNLRVLVARRRRNGRKQLPVFVCFFFLDGQEEESPWRGINRKTIWLRGGPLPFRRRENFRAAKNTPKMAQSQVFSLFFFLLTTWLRVSPG